MDLEGYARRILEKENAVEILKERILEIKDIDEEKAREFAIAILHEVKISSSARGSIFDYPRSGVSMGDFGVGSRGRGDFYVHRKIAEMLEVKSEISPSELDDSGVVKCDGVTLAISVDGIHSRLSDFPFLAGFHATRATLRDVYVMGAQPVALFSDIHIADDGDVGKLFDHIAGISAVSELVGVPVVAGSTLRIGGDMVIGERMSGCVGAVGIVRKLTPRRGVREGDVIILSEGAGGGTIATTAIYNGFFEVVEKTLNVKFLLACESLFRSGTIEKVHAMTDITNGGIRGDAWEISNSNSVKLSFEEEKIIELVDEDVFEMLKALEIDYLGVSLDMLLLTASEEDADEIMMAIRKSNVRCEIVGKVSEGEGVEMISERGVRKIEPFFRESPYTPIKKLVGIHAQRNEEEMKKKVDGAFEKALRKKREIVKKIRDSHSGIFQNIR
jgi:hydrogenase expression/formation protein